ncbi:unnamed protein product [Caenorhabditis auriculariae]|uniref:Uncharacterized protein n=1 Tax=Caenorhabditis auriculariae TaxID=2777116 RepID=A0A8S1GR29_9PELO|nr:unnamed protein product [Caenorhabditis auriculariae]
MSKKDLVRPCEKPPAAGFPCVIESPEGASAKLESFLAPPCPLGPIPTLSIALRLIGAISDDDKQLRRQPEEEARFL